jgi:hypothetical protein
LFVENSDGLKGSRKTRAERACFSVAGGGMKKNGLLSVGKKTVSVGVLLEMDF